MSCVKKIDWMKGHRMKAQTDKNRLTDADAKPLRKHEIL